MKVLKMVHTKIEMYVTVNLNLKFINLSHSILSANHLSCFSEYEVINLKIYSICETARKIGITEQTIRIWDHVNKFKAFHVSVGDFT